MKTLSKYLTAVRRLADCSDESNNSKLTDCKVRLAAAYRIYVRCCDVDMHIFFNTDTHLLRYLVGYFRAAAKFGVTNNKSVEFNGKTMNRAAKISDYSPLGFRDYRSLLYCTPHNGSQTDFEFEPNTLYWQKKVPSMQLTPVLSLFLCNIETKKSQKSSLK